MRTVVGAGNLRAVDYVRIGLKVGLEIHQQLHSKRKLFCSCKPELFKDEAEITFLRRLRPTQSELGQIDPAAFFEFQKGVQILYQADKQAACLVEMDEEPPHRLNSDALKSALIISLLLNANPVDEIHVMRKTVIDGSTTTGFQRTCVVALAGEIKVGEKVIPIQHVGLEEDAARKISEDGNILHYRIDRLCIPLVEVATAPLISNPQEAEEVALAIGRILRATGRVKRGLGTIRQDLNISIRDGALVEIKGVQDLELVSLAVKNEVQRQLNLMKIKEELKKRGLQEADVKEEFVDVTDVFMHTKCKLLSLAIEEKKRVLATKLPKFRGLLAAELSPNLRLGTEMADRAKFWGRVGGLFHTDELPAYGISAKEVGGLRRSVTARRDDAVVFVADNPETASDALKAVNNRAREAVKGVPQETRAAKPDGSTRYMRPRPGAARMYPETDVPPLRLSRSLIESLGSCLPELPGQRLQRLMRDFGLNTKLAKQILDSEFHQLFEEAAKKSNAAPTLVAVTLTETLKALKREGVEVERISNAQFLEVFRLVGSEEAAKEAVPDLLVWLSKHEGSTAAEAVDALALKMLSESELECIIDSLMEEHHRILIEHEAKAFGILMGLVMKKVRGKAKAEVVRDLVKSKLGKTIMK